ncbi:hypothetical protein VIGAN_06024800 [Vigna angularis var. angularis]|uniref:Uncharacterized protein n=1 Tax=Vigna angularis var. angularis TaxID=157739 RepID=A0A0S3S918_PHAAN|nr:hypothetical protein VIGAN_06024800 [Vigna angularis var. angularis]
MNGTSLWRKGMEMHILGMTLLIKSTILSFIAKTLQYGKGDAFLGFLQWQNSCVETANILKQQHLSSYVRSKTCIGFHITR